jgi:predicted Zn-dependent protease
VGLQKKNYDDQSHHFHETVGGPMCVDCHAPQRTYMGVDPRRDHSFRIPRPDLTVKIGTPNACANCHKNKSASWASSAVKKWYGPSAQLQWHYGEAIQAGRNGSVGAEKLLSRVIRDREQPAIVRATAIELLAQYPGSTLAQAVLLSLTDRDPLVRRAAVSAHSSMNVSDVTNLYAMLQDPVRSVRLEVLQVADIRNPSPLMNSVIREFESVQSKVGGRGNGALNLGSMRQQQGGMDEAERLFRQAIREEQTFVPAWVNLADVVRYRSESEAEQILRTALGMMPKAAVLHYSLGLSLVRQRRLQEAIEEFSIAVQLDPTDRQFRETLRLAKEA